LKSKLSQNPTLYQSDFLTEKTEIENDALLGNNITSDPDLIRLLVKNQGDGKAEQCKQRRQSAQPAKSWGWKLISEDKYLSQSRQPDQ